MWNHEEGYPLIDAKCFGRKLKEACDSRCVTAGELQQFLHLGSIQAVYMWFEGRRLPSLDNLYAISKYLGITIEELLEDKKENIDCLTEKSNVPDCGKRLLFYWMHL